MRNTGALLLIIIIAIAVLLAGCGREEELGEWTMPAVDAAPTPVSTAAPAFGGGSTAKYIWNDGVDFNMSKPGVTAPTVTQTLTHAEVLALFGGQFLPKTIFNESYGAYQRMYLEQIKHDVMLDAGGQLAENAYVELRYLVKDWVEASSITVYAELVSPDTAQAIYSSRCYPHLSYAEDALPKMSSYYLQPFVLTKTGDTRYAQWLALPSGYFSFVQRAQELTEQGYETEIPRIPLLTFTCREKVSDEQFIAAVCELGQASSASVVLPDLSRATLPKPGEKGAA